MDYEQNECCINNGIYKHVHLPSASEAVTFLHLPCTLTDAHTN